MPKRTLLNSRYDEGLLGKVKRTTLQDEDYFAYMA